MGFVKTLANVALGVALAKGASYVARNGMPKVGGSGLAGGLGGGLSGGLGGLLDKLGANPGGSRKTRGPHASGFGGLINNAGPMLGGLLGSQTPPPAPGATAPRGFGPVFNQAIIGGDMPEPSRDQELAAALMLRAMVQAAMADGKLDDAENAKLMQHLAEASDAERAYVSELMDQPIDIAKLAADIPDGMEEQVYLISLMAIDLDSRAEAQYLHDLAGALGLDQSMVNDIHKEAGVPPLYA